MTDDQVNLLADAFKRSSFNEDLLVAVVSGMIILFISTAISLLISKRENEKTKEELKARIEIETAENLKIMRVFYLEQVELQDYLSIEEDFEEMSVLLQNFNDKLIDSEEFGMLDIHERIAPTLPYIQKASKFNTKLLNVSKQYDFKEQERVVIENYSNKLSGFISGVLEYNDLSLYWDVDSFEDVMNNTQKCLDVINNKRFKLYKKMRE